MAKKKHTKTCPLNESVAILNFWLLSLIAYNLFRVFFLRNLKLVFRAGKTMKHFVSLMHSELNSCLPVYGGVPLNTRLITDRISSQLAYYQTLGKLIDFPGQSYLLN
jgi:hypothetical protein